MPALLVSGWIELTDRATSRSRHQAQDSQRVFSVDAHEITTGPVLGPTIGVSQCGGPQRMQK